jgi:hypothetical protein
MASNVNKELEAEGRALVALAADRSSSLRLLGGIAVRLTCPSAARAPFDRVCGDLDFASGGKAAAVEAAFAVAGWSPEPEFNLYNGGERLIFRKAGLKADVFLGDFRMCHRIPLGGRLTADPLSLPLAELLLTKLQVVEANGKDLGDAACVLLDHALGDGDGTDINREAFLRPCARDWGLWRTAGVSLAKVLDWSRDHVADASELALIAGRVAELSALLEAADKSIAWKARAVAGDRIRWYELPEEVGGLGPEK